MKHKWKKDHNGEIDTWAWERDFHNGPVCEVCGRTVCENCVPDWLDLNDCSGPRIVTNADYIRSFLTGEDDIREKAEKETLDWLKQTFRGGE